MELKHLTKGDFLSQIADFESSPREWKYLGERPAIIDFYASWCAPCRALSPVLEELADEYAGRVDIFKVDTESEHELSAYFGISSIPTMLFIPKNNAPQIARGAMPKAALGDIIEEFLLEK